MPALTEPLNLGDLLRYKVPNLCSRDRVMIASGQNLPLDTVVDIVTATAKFRRPDSSAEDGTQVTAGVLLQACDATLIDRGDGLVIVHHAIAAHHALARPDTVTTAKKLTAIAQLKALSMFIRQEA